MTDTYHCVDFDIDPALLDGQEFIMCCNDGRYPSDGMLFSIDTIDTIDAQYYCVINMVPNDHICILMLQGKISALDGAKISYSLKNAIIDSGYEWTDDDYD